MKVNKSMLDVSIKRLHHALFSLHAIHFVFVFEHLLAPGLLESFHLTALQKYASCVSVTASGNDVYLYAFV